MTTTTATASTTTTVACSRREHSVWTKCACPDCHTLNLRTRKRRHHGYYNPGPLREQAWANLTRWLDDGWSTQAMSSATGLDEAYLVGLFVRYRRGHRTTIGLKIAQRIVEHGEPARGRISATGSTRRLRALAAIGWKLADVAQRAGVPFTTCEHIRLGANKTVNVPIARAIADVYADLHMTPGPSAMTRRMAGEKDWTPPLGWDDIDDPRERPNVGKRPVGGQGTAIEDVEHLLFWQPWTWAGITARLGVTKSAIEKLCRRHNRYDLLRQLQLNDPAYRDSGGDGPPVDDDGVPLVPDDWAVDALQAAHAAHRRGEESPWVDAGEREYQRRRNARRRTAAREAREAAAA